MILTQDISTPIQTNVSAVAHSYKIKASSRVFKILSSFYGDPLLAIPRELGANAWDSHVKAKRTDREFVVHVPNTLEPWFSIRDFGTGLSDEDITNIYTTYFESTKTGDNDSDGCMGLGSKTPFNYTENFTVTSWFNGVKSVYSNYVSESGYPCFVRLASEETDGENGIEVRFDVKQDDISKFVDKIRQAYASFRHKPKLVGIHEIAYPEVKYTYEGTNWSIREGSRYGCRSSACMGNYMYPIDARTTGYGDCKGLTDEEKRNALAVLNNVNIDLFFNIGDLDVAPNKEQLQFNSDDRTRANILKRASLAYDELKAQVAAKIKTPTTYWEAMKVYTKINSVDAGISLRYVLGDLQVPFNGASIGKGYIMVSDVESKIDATNLPDRHTDAGMYETFLLTFRYAANTLKKSRSSRYTTVGTEAVEPIFFYTGSNGVKSSRVKKYLIDKFGGNVSTQLYLIVDKSAGFARMKAHQAFLGLPDSCFICIEDLPKVAAPRSPKSSSTSPIKTYVDGIPATEVKYLTATAYPSIYFQNQSHTIDSAGTYYYIPMSYGTCFADEGRTKQVTEHMIGYLLKYGVTNGLIPAGVNEVYGINKKNLKALSVGTWINIVDVIMKHFRKHNMKKLAYSLDDAAHAVSIERAIGTFSRMCRVGSYFTEFVGKVESKKSKKIFEYVRSNTVGLTKNQFTPNDDEFVIFFDVKAVERPNRDYTVKEIETIFTEKYMELFNILDGYTSDHVSRSVKIVNFIDANSK